MNSPTGADQFPQSPTPAPNTPTQTPPQMNQHGLNHVGFDDTLSTEDEGLLDFDVNLYQSHSGEDDWGGSRKGMKSRKDKKHIKGVKSRKVVNSRKGKKPRKGKKSRKGVKSRKATKVKKIQ